MPDNDPAALHDLGSDPSAVGIYTYAEKLRSELLRLFPGRGVRAFPRSASDTSIVPSGCKTFEVQVDRKDGESLEGFEAVKRRVERVLIQTELDLTQPGTGGRYLRTIDYQPPRPIGGTIGDDHQATVGWSFIVYLDTGLVRAEDIVLQNERIRGSNPSRRGP
jgi:hypothetical protein